MIYNRNEEALEIYWCAVIVPEMKRRLLLATLVSPLAPSFVRAQDPPTARDKPLPLEKTFIGRAKFDAIVKKALAENWRALPIGERVVKFGREFHHVPYKSFTLEIDDRIESPSANLEGLDCWSFFEISLGLSRMIAAEKTDFTPDDLLDQIQLTRYRGGVCTGNYLERIHYLAEWFFENDSRGTIDHLTREFPGAKKITGCKIQEMTVLWKSYRYLRENPELRAPMKTWEDYVAKLPVYHVEKSKVAAIEPKLKNGDIIGIATNQHGGFCSHVGVAVRTDDGVMRLMHASRNHKKVVIDKAISAYLADFKYHAGILVGRPLEVDRTVVDQARYQASLQAAIAEE